MDFREHVGDALCPACRAPGLLVAALSHDVPYYGDVVETVVRCPSCGFRHADFLVTSQREPVRYSIKVEPATLAARVVRSTSGTWRIPELGFTAEPTARSESFVTNVEGMMDRARDVLMTARDFNREDDTKLVIAERLLERVDRIVRGEEEATLVLEDPLGNSLIADPRATRTMLTEEEASTLETGFVLFSKDELD